MSIKRSLKSDNRGLKFILLIAFFKSLTLFWILASNFVKHLNWSMIKLPPFQSMCIFYPKLSSLVKFQYQGVNFFGRYPVSFLARILYICLYVCEYPILWFCVALFCFRLLLFSFSFFFLKFLLLFNYSCVPFDSYFFLAAYILQHIGTNDFRN